MSAISALPAPLRTTAVAAVAALLVTGLAGCGSKDDAGSKSPFAKDTTSSAPTTSAPATSAGSSASTTSGSASAPSAAGSTVSADQMSQILSKGISSITTAHAHMTMDIMASGRSLSMSTDVDLQTKPLAEKMSMSLGPMQMQGLLLDGTMYLKAPMMGTDKWIKVDAKELGALGGGGMSATLTDPLSIVEQMGPYIDNATYVGSDSVGKHYKMTVDLSGMMQKMGIPAGSGQVPSSATEEVWVDAQGRVVKTIADLGPSQTVTMVMSDFGKPVHVTAPPAGQVTTMPNMGGGMGSLGG